MSLTEAKKAHAIWGSEQHREKARQSSLRYWADISEEKRAEFRESLKWSEERKASRSKMLRKRLADPKQSAIYRKNLSKAVIEANKRPEVIAKRKEVMNDPELKAHLLKARKAQGKDPVQQKLNREVRQPLAVVSRLLKNGKITEHEAQIRRSELYTRKEEILNSVNDA